MLGTQRRRLRGRLTAGFLTASVAWMVGAPAMVQAYPVPIRTAAAIQQAIQTHTTAPVWVPTWVPSIVGKTQDHVTPLITWAAQSYQVAFVITPTAESAFVESATGEATAWKARFGTHIIETGGYGVTQYKTRTQAHAALWQPNRGVGILSPHEFGPAHPVALSSSWTAYWHPKAGALTWREGDWTIEVSGQPQAPTPLGGAANEARQIARSLEQYRLPPAPGIISVEGNASGGQFTLRWQEGRTVISTSGQDFYGLSVAFPKQGVELVVPPSGTAFTPWAHMVASMVHLRD